MAILVTGGAGFVGANLAARLIEEYPDTPITVLDALVYPMGERNLPQEVRDHTGFRLVRGSVTDAELLRSLIGEGDLIIHMAVETGRPGKFIETQLGGTKTLLDVATEKKVRRVVFQSTSDVYGINDSENLTEEHPVRATHLYAATKLGAEGLVTSYYHTHGLPIAVLRPVSIYGPRQYPGWLIPRFLNLGIAGKPLPVLGSGSACRDWIHVDDICSGLIAALEAPIEGEILNLGTGKEWSVMEIAKMILELTGQPPTQIEHLPERPGDFEHQVTRADKARKLMGWQAEIAFPDGLKQTLEWYRAHQDWVSVQVGKDADKLGFRVKDDN